MQTRCLCPPERASARFEIFDHRPVLNIFMDHCNSVVIEKEYRPIFPFPQSIVRPPERSAHLFSVLAEVQLPGRESALVLKYENGRDRQIAISKIETALTHTSFPESVMIPRATAGSCGASVNAHRAICVSRRTLMTNGKGSSLHQPSLLQQTDPSDLPMVCRYLQERCRCQGSVFDLRMWTRCV